MINKRLNKAISPINDEDDYSDIGVGSQDENNMGNQE